MAHILLIHSFIHSFIFNPAVNIRLKSILEKGRPQNQSAFLLLIVPSLLALSIVISGCSAVPRIDGFLYPPAVVAVLPLDNETVNLKGPEYIKTLFSEKLAKRGYHLVEPWRVDEALKSFGVTDAGQIKHINLQELGKKLNADGIFYGTLKDFSFKHVVVAGLKRVEVHMELINVQNGQMVWSADVKASNSGITLAPIDKAFGSTPLANEAKEVVLKLINKLLR